MCRGPSILTQGRGFDQLEAAADLARARYEHDAALWETKALMAAETVAEEEAARLRDEADTQAALEREGRLHAEQHGRCVCGLGLACG